VWRAGLLKIRVRDDSGAYRVLYVANLEKAVYVLHTFQKKTRATSKREIELAQKRFRELMKEQK
jgi:phage-related protein